MIQRIINSISLLLKEYFPDYQRLDMEAEQDVSRPAFFIACINSEQVERITRSGEFKYYNFDVMFDPGHTEPEKLCYKVGDICTEIFRRIPDVENEFDFRPVGGIETTVQDGILHVIFQIRESFIPVNNDEPVEGFELHTNSCKVKYER